MQWAKACAEWHRSGTGGRLTLPLSAGLRHGLATGDLTSDSRGSKTRIDLELHPFEYHLHRPAAYVLLIGALGAVAMVLVPIFPALVGFVPLGFLALLLAWFLVLSQIKNRSPEDFLSVVCEIAEEGHQGGPDNG